MRKHFCVLHVLKINVKLVHSGKDDIIKQQWRNQPISGNVLVIIVLLSKYDPLLQEIISGPKNSEKQFMSNNTLNELIQILSKKVENILKQTESALSLIHI